MLNVQLWKIVAKGKDHDLAGVHRKGVEYLNVPSLLNFVVSFVDLDPLSWIRQLNHYEIR